MFRQIKTLTGVELINLFGFNELRHIRDKREKKKKTALAAVLVIVILLACAYVGGIAYALIYLGAAETVPAYLMVIASFLILFFGFFKTGNVIFRRNGYDIIASLPVSQTAVVISRFLRMYVEELLLTCVVMLPGMLVYGVMLRPAFSFYLFGIAGLLFVPLIPLSVAVFVGALITGISSRARNKSFVETALSVALVVVVLAFTTSINGMGELDMERLKQLSGQLSSLSQKVYPPSLWLGEAMTEAAFGQWLLFAVVSVAVFAAAAAVVSRSFQTICRMLFVNSAKHNYRMQTLTQDSLLVSMCRRELKRCFASGVYMTNTIIGPILGAVASVALFFAGTDLLAEQLPFELDMTGVLPFGVATVFCMMNLACVSISMEGKNWWIAKSLPLETRMVLDAKLLASIVVTLPFYIVAEIFMILALRPGFADALLTILAPLVFIAFCAVFGITVNLRLPLMKWENEVSVVKQSASALIGGLGGALVPLIGAFAAALAPKAYSLPIRFGVCILVMAVTAVLYVRNNRFNLQEIE